jgi:hypothetical protein
MTRYAEGYVAAGELGMWVHRLNDFKPFLWEYPKVTVLELVKGKRSTWLRVRDEAGRVHRVLARRVYGEEAARRWHPDEARAIWGARPSGRERQQ